MVRAALIIIGACLGLSVPLPAASQSITGNDIYDQCVSESPGCTHYVAGVLDGLQFFNAVSDPSLYCIPSGVTNKQLIDIFRRFLTENPEHRHRPASYILVVAISEAYPCENGAVRFAPTGGLILP